MKYLRKYKAMLTASPLSCVVTLALSALALYLIFLAGAMVYDGAGYALTKLRTSAADARGNANDAAHEGNVSTYTGGASASETNANNFSTDRIRSEERARAARARQTEAAQNSNLTLEPTRKAKRRYEESRQMVSDPAAPPLSDADLCAELGKRNIRAAGCQ